MAASTALTVKEFLDLPLPEGERVELVRGEVVKMGHAGWIHERVKANTNKILVSYILQNPVGEVYAETMFELSDTDARQPDVSLLLNEQIPVPAGPGLPKCAPALAVEIVSSESAADLEDKIELYFQKGTRTVLVLYPAQRAVRISEPGGLSRRVSGAELVKIDWLAGFAVPAERFFEGL